MLLFLSPIVIVFYGEYTCEVSDLSTGSALQFFLKKNIEAPASSIYILIYCISSTEGFEIRNLQMTLKRRKKKKKKRKEKENPF